MQESAWEPRPLGPSHGAGGGGGGGTQKRGHQVVIDVGKLLTRCAAVNHPTRLNTPTANAS
ncbi:hypothetical protein SCOCK_80039 [Actinacidiphila cocklensis]|uniref:Uncharacterized protein n=1 Tax=Actinacidiphila cocklensis TaxID=887465 RepID=A0A9W4EBQ3_9ACTN|nr:hypothetical protein SCOCK_80039 [Actinacidiphila cocklensis]